ncbi:hypothetical protein DFJ73DRAFT_784731 [Zopfochytrium polystomum]|nr:hypothetical protein DFJ73DRAFT_784731 [Zopfochytrium polystomum]
MHAVLKLAIQAALVEPALVGSRCESDMRLRDGYDGESGDEQQICAGRIEFFDSSRIDAGVQIVLDRVTHGGKTDTAILLYADSLTCYAFGREAVAKA